LRKDIEFSAEGPTLRGWLYLPEGNGPFPTIVMAHGFSAVKEHLVREAERFYGAGFAVLAYDHRNFGASDGEPRQEIDPILQIRDYRHAISYARMLPEIDGDRIGVWGSSFSGGHVLVLGAVDRRIKCVVSQVPTISGSASSARRVRPDLVAELLSRLEADREARFAGSLPQRISIVSDNPEEPCALAGEESWQFLVNAAKDAPSWRNEITLRSVEMAREYEPGICVDRISPTPLLMIVASEDTLTPTDLALKAFERALPLKKLKMIPGGHFPVYEEHFEEAVTAACDWFTEHLKV
jgi:fermentation-respiration switch protein FrsA (DUF1100 family)